MAENTDTGDETLEKPININPENPSEEIIPSTEPDIIILNQESENMEVHHHPDLHHKPKQWKEYILEFIKIFLAVTMGFCCKRHSLDATTYSASRTCS